MYEVPKGLDWRRRSSGRRGSRLSLHRSCACGILPEIQWNTSDGSRATTQRLPLEKGWKRNVVFGAVFDVSNSFVSALADAFVEDSCGEVDPAI